jgi:cleavage and polyadenylation specificity factor subunit 3
MSPCTLTLITPFAKVMGVIDVKRTEEYQLAVEWDSSASNDMIADSTIALLTGVDKSPASVKRTFFPCIISLHYPYYIVYKVTSRPHNHPHVDSNDEESRYTRIRRLGWFLETHFGAAAIELHMPEESAEGEEGQADEGPSFIIRLEEADVLINLVDMVSAKLPSTPKFLTKGCCRLCPVLTSLFAGAWKLCLSLR